MTKCRILWWQVTGEGARGNRQAFEDADVEVEVLNRGINPQYHLSQGADFLFTGMIYEMLNWSMMGLVKLPSVIQGGGYGPHFLPKGKLDRDFHKVTDIPKSLVTILDPNYYSEMKKSRLPFDYDKVHVVPNGLTKTLTNFPKLPKKKRKEFIVFNPSGNFWVKNPSEFIEATKIVSRENLPIKFVFPIKTRSSYCCPIEWLKCENVELSSIYSLPQMYMMYQNCDLVASYSGAEIMPTTFFESLWFGKPTIHNKPAMLQSVRMEVLEEMTKDFGLSISDFDKKWKSEYMEGQHFGHVDSPKEFAEAVILCYDKETRDDLADRGKEWISKWWLMSDKAKLLVDMLKTKKYI